MKRTKGKMAGYKLSMSKAGFALSLILCLIYSANIVYAVELGGGIGITMHVGDYDSQNLTNSSNASPANITYTNSLINQSLNLSSNSLANQVSTKKNSSHNYADANQKTNSAINSANAESNSPNDGRPIVLRSSAYLENNPFSSSNLLKITLAFNSLLLAAFFILILMLKKI